ncbi:family 43 glycosylhydrolase [Pedobacter sp. BMA]|uniref:family 43 glycosylhydrolase n=1 Tax=Pedobacter sp. BMA TaxID=1663685 RepID=UPI00064B2DD6|nr:family 43 glycosylhydrolase [Pedobacter sp. BMA]KLT65266.1 beta-xylosidase [Pedobacter sp. BMA]
MKTIGLSIAIFTLLSLSLQAQFSNIKNDVFWYTKDQQPIYSQGGGIFKFTDPISNQQKYYWYGVHYAEADLYRQNPAITHHNATFESVTCYSSTDLINWSREKDVLTKEYLNSYGGKTWVGRLGVVFIKSLKQYAMFVQHGKKLLITVSSSPTGNFTIHQEIDMTPFIGTSNTGDQTVFTDEGSGKSYLIYSYGRGRNKIYISEIGVKENKVTILDCTEVFKGESREGNCMFKYNGKYYMCASNIYGWDSSYAYFLVADNIRGPYKPHNSMKIMQGCENDFAHVTQTGFFVSVKGTKQETIIFCGDRWANFAGNGLGYNQWTPLSFSGAEPYFNSLSSWDLNEKTGEWIVGDANNYALNGSFEADRNRIPSSVKPVQEQLTGWNTVITKGNKISPFDPNTSFLNYLNTEADRKFVTGEKSMLITDSVAFIRTVSQTIHSAPAVVLTDGIYQLTFKAKTIGPFNQLKIFASSNNNKIEQPIITTNNDWKEIKLANIEIQKGSAQIGFYADGLPNSVCLIDDVYLTKIK